MVQSERFTLCNGVKKGGLLSPLLLCLYASPLIQELNESKLGYDMGMFVATNAEH